MKVSELKLKRNRPGRYYGYIEDNIICEIVRTLDNSDYTIWEVSCPLGKRWNTSYATKNEALWDIETRLADMNVAEILALDGDGS